MPDKEPNGNRTNCLVLCMEAKTKTSFLLKEIESIDVYVFENSLKI